MRKLILVLGLLAFAPLCHGQNNVRTCPCAVGTSCTTDGGLVTAYCGIGATPQSAIQPGALYSYGAGPFASFADAFEPNMDYYCFTAHCASDTDPTFIVLPNGGNATAGLDWAAGFASANGSTSAAGFQLVDGTAFTGTPAAGTHYNMVVPQTQSYTALALNSAITAGASSVSIANPPNHYWPSSGSYTVCVDQANQECLPATTGSTPYTSPFTVNITGTFANNHSSGVYAFAEDSNGQGGPTYPTFYKWTTCDLARLMSYLNGVSGNKHYVLWSVSGTAAPASNVLGYGKTLETMAAPEGCGYTSADTSWVVDAASFVSPLYDMGIETEYTNLNTVQAQTPPCSNLTIGAGPSSFLMGPYATLNGGTGSFTVPNPLTYSRGALTWSSPNALSQAGRNLSLAGCRPDVANSCFYASNGDGYMGKTDTEGGAIDNSNPCPTQQAWLGSAPGASGLIQPGVGHGANYSVNAAGGSNCGTSASSGGMCSLSDAFIGMVSMLANLRVYGNVSAGGIVGGGVH